MKDISIRVENLSKKYTIASAKYRSDSLREQVTNSLKSLFRSSAHAQARDDAFWALKDISFEIKQGEIVGIIGQNGAGKSTLLKILSRITVPTSGKAEIYGRVGSLLEVGTGFHPELTGRENVYLSGAVIGMKKDEIRRHFDSIVDFAEIEKFLEVPVKRYSSGMYVRLAFAVAAHLEPEILLVDEVLSVGDAAFQKKCLAKIGEASKNGRTVLFISHNMVAVNSLCGRVIWIQGGRIAEDGATAQIVTDYLSKTEKGEGRSEEKWTDMRAAPGNEQVRIRRVSVKRRDNLQDGPLTMETPFQVEVECWNLAAGAQLHITLHLYTAEGLIAFTTGSLNERPLPEGVFRSVCYFPANLLNSGLHRFVVLVVKDTSNVIYSHESGVSFDIIDTRQRQGTWFGREPGVVQPTLQWTTEYLGKAPAAETLIPAVRQAE